MKVVIFDNPDGTITVRNPVLNAAPPCPSCLQEGETEEERFERLVDAVAHPPRKGGTRVTVMDHMDFPVDHEHFKIAREWNGTRVVVSMTKARVEHERRIDEDRLEHAKALNLRSIMGENVAAEIALLRNTAQHKADIALAQTPSELKAVWQTGTPRR